jgi:hypothetical protein
MTAPTGEACASCIYWQRKGHETAAATIDASGPADVGTCHFYPPRVADVGPFAAGMWPRTHESRWCGEWEGPEPDDGERASDTNVVPFQAAA